MITIAQVGVGYWGPNLLRNLVAHPECKVKTVVDTSSERCAFVRNHYPHINTTNDIAAVLSDDAINAVVIATPVATHFELTLRSLIAGKHVLVEKPMAQTVMEIEQIDDYSYRNDVVAMVGHTFLYNSAVRYLKKLVDSGELGDIRYIYSQRLNLGRIRSDVDALQNFAHHDVSIIQYLLNGLEPLSVQRQGMSYVQQGIDDVAFLHVTYPEKIVAHIHVSWLDPHKVRTMTIVGSKKMVVYDDMAENKIAIYDKGIDRMAVLGEHMDFDNPDFFEFNHRSGDVVLPKIHYEEPLKVEIAHFIDCLQRGHSCLTGPEHAKEVVRIVSGAVKREVVTAGT